MTAARKPGLMRRVAKFVLLLGLLAGGVMVAAELSGHSLGALVQNYNLERDVRVIGAQADAQLRRSTNVAARQVGGAALAQTIRYSRGQALAEQVYSIPDDIRQELEPHFPSIDFDTIRWKPASGSLTLGTVMTQWYLSEGAVVLEDVVVFTSASLITDRRLWAHELTHVVQYQQLGIDGFARAYVLGHTAIERQAEDNALRVMKKLAEG
ncbi:MAG TPA: DUF4157 domain-containing protein [Paracoccaceae bacterium]|nr:DUF4157 domain-containing protein [Paracoccaceae bacterium]